MIWGRGRRVSGWVDLGALAEFEGGLVEWQAGVKSPEVELIASGAAAEQSNHDDILEESRVSAECGNLFAQRQASEPRTGTAGETARVFSGLSARDTSA